MLMRYRNYFTNVLLTMFLGSAVSAFGVTAADDEIRQKLGYASTFIGSSAAAKRIEASEHAEARAIYQAAQDKMSAAQRALSSGNLDEASARSDEAMNLMSKAAQLVPSESITQMAKARHEKLLQGIETLQASWQAAVKEAGTHDSSALDTDRIQQMKGKANALADAGKYDEANEILVTAMDEVSAALNRLHGDKTISYEMIFSSPAEEYAYELVRYRSLEDAIPLAIEQMHSSQDEIDKAQAYINGAKQNRLQAAADAQQGKYDYALLRIRDGAQGMETALNVLGVTY